MRPITCRYVEHRPFAPTLTRIWNGATSNEAPEVVAKGVPRECPPTLRRGSLHLQGPGAILVAVPLAAYEDVRKTAGDKPLRLFLNGFDMGAQGHLSHREQVDGKPAQEAAGGKEAVQAIAPHVILRFNVSARQSSAEAGFWSNLYEQAGLLDTTTLRVGVGWDKEPVFTDSHLQTVEGNEMTAQVAHRGYVVFSSVLLVAFLGLFLWALYRWDIFRTRTLDPWWSDVRALRTQHVAKALREGKVSLRDWQAARVASFPALPEIWWGKAILQPFRAYNFKFDKFDANGPHFTDLQNLVRASGRGFSWPTTTTAADQAKWWEERKDFAGRMLKGEALTDDQRIQALLGLVTREEGWTTPRLPFSLARVQSGTWLMFAVGAALYLWAVYGQFPALSGSVLALLAISAATTGTSLMVDGSKATGDAPSRGILDDLITDADGVHQAHRYQALVVNLLLLVVGVAFVAQYLAFPTFDPTWLGLLGLSGIAQTVGKQAVERDKGAAPPKVP
ncbi:hypothetical protein [Pseudorhodoferax sp. Leaf265]|uniref:hypothetical protein n=1 Tax=Pseudorhodoferax sp. Leaf265 TaxID=1736315 RepID=UPI0012E70BAF|nr:hypothetical protein [Pseudorhodoferax sp. Leaf265]